MSTRIVSCGPHLSSLEPMLRITILDCHPCKQLHSIVTFQNNSYFKKHSSLGILRFIQRDQMKPECFCTDKLPLGMRNFSVCLHWKRHIKKAYRSGRCWKKIPQEAWSTLHTPNLLFMTLQKNGVKRRKQVFFPPKILLKLSISTFYLKIMD